MRQTIIYLTITLMLCITTSVPAENILPQSPQSTDIIIDGKTVLTVYSGTGSVTAQERADIIKNRLLSLNNLGRLNAGLTATTITPESVNIHYDNTLIISILDNDIKNSNLPREELILQYTNAIKQYISSKQNKIDTLLKQQSKLKNFINQYQQTIIDIGISVAILILIIVGILLLSKMFNAFYTFIKNKREKLFKTISFRGNEIISGSSLVTGFILFVKGIKLATIFIILYFYFKFIFTMFPWTRSEQLMTILQSWLYTFVTLAIAIGIYKTIKLLFNILKRNVFKWQGGIIKPLKLKNIEIITAAQIAVIIKNIFSFIHLLINVLILYVSIPIILGYFDFTRHIGNIILGYLIAPLKTMGKALIGFLPDLFFIVVIIVTTRYIIKLIKMFFIEMQKGNITFTNFNREWADPTFKIIRFLILILALIIMFPYLPGSQSEAFKGISIFLGILFSLGSTSAIANIVTGIILTYMNAFQVGDRVKIGDTVGDVLEKTLLVTRIKTVKNAIISIPNAAVLNDHIINYSTSASQEGLILHTTITIGYDVPWKKMHETLLEAAKQTANILPEPEPFVLQTSLDDYYVSYELNVYTNKPRLMAKTYSLLHQNIQDKCNESGIEIMSPIYNALRDGNTVTIPRDYIKDTPAPRGFFVELINKIINKDK